MTAPFDTSKPNVARMYDYWLGGKDNYKADRNAAEAVRALRPNVAQQALDNKMFQTRAVTYVAGQGVRQFLDIGSGLPTSPPRADGDRPLWLATHEAAQAATEDPLVAYVDDDQVAVMHSKTMLAGGRHGVIATIGDMRDPAAILGDADVRHAGFDLDAPICVILACVLHFVDARMARDIVTGFARACAPGSYAIISVGFARGQDGAAFARTYNGRNGPTIYAHTWEQITALFDGFELVPPGIVDAAVWRPEWQEKAHTQCSNMIAAAVARKNSSREPKGAPPDD